MRSAAPPAPPPLRWSRSVLVLLWFIFYASWTLRVPALLDDADSVHAEVAREMLLRHDPVTLYANGVRYLEKAPLLYWSMAACQWFAGALGLSSPPALATASRVPLAVAVLLLALLCEAFARRLFASGRAGSYAGLGVLSSFGVFLFTRITIPDALVCLWIVAALFCFWRTEEIGTVAGPRALLRWSLGFAAACALNVLSKGLIGIVFPLGIVSLYLWLTRGWRGAWARVSELHPWPALGMFLLLAAPWHLAAGLANPAQGHPAPFRFVGGHWQVPLPTDGNVRGWFWFYFVNEHALRYLNLRVPRDYDTAPLWLFWGLCLVWLMPWSAFVFEAAGWAVPLRSSKWRGQFARHDLPRRSRGLLLLAVWAAFVLLFFSFSTRQEYYVLPAFPALLVLVAGWLARCSFPTPDRSRERAAILPSLASASALSFAPASQAFQERCRHTYLRCVGTLTALGGLFAVASVLFLLHTRAPPPGTDLAGLLQQNPGEYALSMGHFLDLNGAALGLFRVPLALAAVSLFGGPLTAWVLRRRKRDFAANYALVAGAFGFLLAAHLGLQTFAPVITSAPLAEAIAPFIKPGDLLAIHGEYESGSTLGFYLKRRDLHVLEGRSSNLWYGSFFPDAPPIFETPASLAATWGSPRRVFLWQSQTDEPKTLPSLPGHIYVVAEGGGKEIVSNQRNR